MALVQLSNKLWSFLADDDLADDEALRLHVLEEWSKKSKFVQEHKGELMEKKAKPEN